jgi:hypothetical protein
MAFHDCFFDKHADACRIIGIGSQTETIRIFAKPLPPLPGRPSTDGERRHPQPVPGEVALYSIA